MNQPAIAQEAPVLAAPRKGDECGGWRGGKVSFRVRRLEPQLAWAIAAYTVWATVFLEPDALAPWLLAAYASFIGLWGRQFPAHEEWLMLVRGMLLLCGGFLLQLAGDTHDPTGPYFIWPVMVATVYALLLGRRMALVLTVAAAVQYIAACWVDGVESARVAGAQAAVLAFFPFMAMVFGRTLHAMDAEAENAHIDRRSQFYNEAGFFSHGAQLLEDCRRGKRPFSLVLLSSADLHDAAELVGKKAANRMFAQLVSGLAEATPRDGLAARTDAHEFALALPGLAAEKAAARLHECLGAPAKVTLNLKGKEVTVILDTLVAEVAPELGSLEDIYDRLRARLHKRVDRNGPAADAEPGAASSLMHGLLQDGQPVARGERPTMPMHYGPLGATAG